MRTILISTLLVAASLILPVAHAQPSNTNTKQLAVLRAQAEKGDAEAQSELAQAFYLGEFGAATNYVEAVKWYRKAAEQNFALAQYNLGVAYREGRALKMDDVEAVKWFRKAAEQNYAGAQYNLGNCYQNGVGVARDHVEAVKWFQRAAEQNDARSQFNLGVFHEHGEGLAKDEAEAVKWYRKAVEQNFAPAQYNLGVCYEFGVGVAKDQAEAVKWYRKAAAQNHAIASYNLGNCYREGLGVARDDVEAVKWLRQAAEQNYAPAQNNLSLCYQGGTGVTTDVVEAYKWVILASAQGNEGAREFAITLERQLTREQQAEGQKRAGDFKPPEVPSSQPWSGESYGKPPVDLRAKAETGDAKAQNELGEVYYAGKLGVAKDSVEAVKWFRKAAEQNFAPAQSNLGICYERGDGVAKYELEAYKWDLLAAAQGDTKSKRNASMLELMLTPEEIAAGKRRTNDWLKQRKNPAR